MTANGRLNLLSCAIFALILLLINVVYFVAYGGGHYPSCGPVCIIFLNVAALSLFLPAALSGKDDEKNQRAALKIICVAYLVVEIAVAWCFLRAGSTALSAGLTQGILCGVFLISLFVMARASVSSSGAIQQERDSRSLLLLEAAATLRVALAEARSASERDALREAIAVLQSTPLASAPQLDVIDNQIASAAQTLAEQPSDVNCGTLCRLLRRRQTMLTLVKQ